MALAVIIDTEATDKDPKTSQVIELAEWQIGVSPAQFMDQTLPFLTDGPNNAGPTNHLYGHSVPIKFGAMAAHHILPEELVGLPLFESYNTPLFCDYVIGHNIDYDAEVLGLDKGVRRICTLALARRMWPQLDAHNQTALMYYIGSLHEGGYAWARDRLKNAHRAADDVENCAIVLQHLLFAIYKVAPEALELWETLYQFSEEARIPTHMTFGKHAGEPISAVPYGYVKWYLGTDDQDPYLVKAFRRAGKI